MILKFLGTGTSQGIPVVACKCATCKSEDPRDKRLRTSVFIQYKNVDILIDTGPDLRQQLLQNHIEELDAILLTHEHADHTAGLDDIRPLYFKNRRPIPLYAIERVVQDLQKRFQYIFGDNDYPGIPKLDLITIDQNSEFLIKGLPVRPLPVIHGQLPILGFAIGPLAYITDAKYIDHTVLDSIKGIDCLVVNALHFEEHHSHFNLQQALDTIQKIQPKVAYLVHMSHHMGKTKNLESQLPTKVFLAYDGLEIVI
ncbi:MAG: MBL fold metallo-hydrolase [Saprospiraceae bacterium]|nr:MBL fold metallo-hydrolase [Saprospiraceae bacterium]MBK9631455.1 MBL fold metallo-hydrolase [Saprospiraceae bacterium]